MDMVDTNRPTAAKQEIEMRQEIAPFGQNRHGTVQLCSKTKSALSMEEGTFSLGYNNG